MVDTSWTMGLGGAVRYSRLYRTSCRLAQFGTACYFRKMSPSRGAIGTWTKTTAVTQSVVAAMRYVRSLLLSHFWESGNNCGSDVGMGASKFVVVVERKPGTMTVHIMQRRGTGNSLPE